MIHSIVPVAVLQVTTDFLLLASIPLQSLLNDSRIGHSGWGRIVAHIILIPSFDNQVAPLASKSRQG
jgi:hypothetical protein